MSRRRRERSPAVAPAPSPFPWPWAIFVAALAIRLFYWRATADASWPHTIGAPITLHASAWYAGRALPVVAVLVGLAIYGFHTALGGKSAVGGALDD